jgi:hypothetical protein
LQKDFHRLLGYSKEICPSAGENAIKRFWYHVGGFRYDDIGLLLQLIEESPRLISLWINQAHYSAGPERGHIDNLVFKNILGDPHLEPLWKNP